MMIRNYFILLILAASISAVPCHADSLQAITPFRVSNQSPLVQIFGLPAESSAFITPHTRYTLSVTTDIASSATSSSTQKEQIRLDGESTRITTSLRYGLGTSCDIGIAVPVLHHGGGFLDQFIITWHRLFSLPQGERTSTPKNRLNYSYRKDNKAKLPVNNDTTTIGDIVLSGGMQLSDFTTEQSRSSLALRTDFKLPTGDSALLAGSGSYDLALSLAGSHLRFTSYGTTAFFASAGVAAMTRGDILPDQQNRLAAFGSAGAGWSPAGWVDIKLQLNGHSALYHGSTLTELSRPSLMLTSGGAIRFGSYLLDIGVSEDVAVATAPDVTFHLQLKRYF